MSFGRSLGLFYGVMEGFGFCAFIRVRVGLESQIPQNQPLEGHLQANHNKEPHKEAGIGV